MARGGRNPLSIRLLWIIGGTKVFTLSNGVLALENRLSGVFLRTEKRFLCARINALHVEIRDRNVRGSPTVTHAVVIDYSGRREDLVAYPSRAHADALLANLLGRVYGHSRYYR